jgi:hypothetical protein
MASSFGFLMLSPAEPVDITEDLVQLGIANLRSKP